MPNLEYVYSNDCQYSAAPTFEDTVDSILGDDRWNNHDLREQVARRLSEETRLEQLFGKSGDDAMDSAYLTVLDEFN